MAAIERARVNRDYECARSPNEAAPPSLRRWRGGFWRYGSAVGPMVHTDCVAQYITKQCQVGGCDRPHESRGLCHSHAEFQRRTGRRPTEPIRTMDPLERFLAKVTKLPSGHWIWRGSTDGDGRYGSFQYDGRVQRAHRVAWMLFRGSIPEEAIVEHLCRRTLCVNPDHLEPSTQKVNVHRGDSPSAHNAAKTHCIRGHEYTPENVRLTTTGGRQCVPCEQREEARIARRDATRRYRERLRTGTSSRPGPGTLTRG